MKKILLIIATLYICAPAFCLGALSGLDALEEDNFKILKGKRIGLLTNHTAVNKEGIYSVDLMILNRNVNLTAIFSPEHGFTGLKDHGEICLDECYNGINVYSLYGSTKRILPKWFNEIDALVFDIQDVGTRYYTYLATMAMAMEDANKHNIEFIVLDRPNPINAEKFEGPVLEEVSEKLTAYFPFPVRHGFTTAEAALFHAARKKLKTPTVVKMKNYNRASYFDETGLIWLNPSPNIRSTDAALLYSGTGIFEASNLSVGRGTAAPFINIGAPWLKADIVAKILNSQQNLNGINFVSTTFTPDSDVFKNQPCRGIKFEIISRNAINTFELFVYTACAIRDAGHPEFEFKPSAAQTMTGTKDFFEMFKEGLSAEEIIKRLSRKPGFEKTREEFLLY